MYPSWEQLFKIARDHCAFTGLESDRKGIRAAIVEAFDAIEYQGKSLPTSGLPDPDTSKIEEGESSKTKSVKPRFVVPDDPVDRKSVEIDALIKRAVDRAVGVARPEITPAVTSVKSADERRFDAENKSGRTVFKDYKSAIGFSSWLCHRAATRRGDEGTAAKLAEVFEHATKGYTTGSATLGGATVGESWSSDIINHMSLYGVARRLAAVFSDMPEQKLHLTIAAGIRTPSYPTEGSAPVEDTGVTYSNASLAAKRGQINVYQSNSLLKHARFGIGERVASEMALGFAYIEDNTLLSSSTTKIGGRAGLQVASPTANEFDSDTLGASDSRSILGGGSMDAHTITHIVSMLALLPVRFRARAVLTCSAAAFNLILQRLAATTPGGVTLGEFLGFGQIPYFLGVPVIVNNVMNSTIAGAGPLIDIFYGDFASAAAVGNHASGLQIDVFDQTAAASDQTLFRGVMEHDLIVHSKGTTTSAGPIVALYQS